MSKTELDTADELAFQYSSQHLNSPSDNDINQSFEAWRDELFPSLEPLESDQRPAATEPREIIFDGKLVVNGYIAGEIRSDDGELFIEQSGEIDGDIAVSFVTIHGKLRGDIRAGRVALGSSARVIGDIETAELFIQPGAVFKGQCTSPKTSAPNESSSEITEPDQEALATSVDDAR